MPKNTANDFDFDDWAGLYLENPAEFEARRQAALMLELLRSSSPGGAEAGRRMLDSFDLAVAGRRPEERMNIAANLMMDSLHQLSAELQLLTQELKTLEQATEQAEAQLTTE